MEQGRELRQQLFPDVGGDGTAVIQAQQVLRYTAHQEVGPCLVRRRPARMEEGRIPVAERLQMDLCGAPAEQRTLATQHLSFHESQVRTAHQEHHVAGIAPPPVPAVLQLRDQARTGGGDPLKLVEGQHQLGPRVGAGPLLGHGAQRLLPAGYAQLREQRHAERAGGLGQKLPHLQRRRRLLAQVVDAARARHELENQLALAHPAPPVDRNELRSAGLEGTLQQTQLGVAPDKPLHNGKISSLVHIIKSY